MSENPYAAPATTESEIPSTLYWRTDGAGILAKNGSVLPKVDLETGAVVGEMRPWTLVLQRKSRTTLIWVAGLAVAYLALDWEIDFLMVFLMVFVGSLLANWIPALRGSQSIVTVTAFAEAPKQDRRRRQERFRGYITWAAVLLFFILPGFAASKESPLQWFGIGILILIGAAVWRSMDHPKLARTSEQTGWMRISGVHPLALAELQRIEAEADSRAVVSGKTAKRKVFTRFLHKYPLRALLGRGWINNPLLVPAIAIMKWTRSARLQRETFHFSESSPLPAGEMHSVLRSAMDSWLATHPDWSLARAECLPSPAGDVTMETLYLASPGLQHSLVITCVWIQQKPAAAKADHTFGTWIAGGKLVITTSQYLLPFSRPDVYAIQVSGTPEKIYTAHLARCAPFEIDPPRDVMELEARMTKDREEFSALLEAAGWQGPVRENF